MLRHSEQLLTKFIKYFVLNILIYFVKLKIKYNSCDGVAPFPYHERKTVGEVGAGGVEKMFKTFHKNFLNTSWICFCTEME